MRFDIAIIGLGAHGSAIAAHCAAAGLSVCGIDAGVPPHSGGSHHGESRIIRKAYYEDPVYVPLLQRAYALWDALGVRAGEQLLKRTGGLMMGPSSGELVPGALQSARLHGLPHTWLNSVELTRRYPDFKLAPGHEAVFEPEAGFLRPELCVRAHLAEAKKAGATLLMGRRARLAGRSATGLDVELSGSHAPPERVTAQRLVVAAGAALVGMGLPCSPLVRVERQVVAHFDALSAVDASRMRRLPVFAIEETNGRFHYGFPDLGSGVKVAQHHGGTVVAGEEVDGEVREHDIGALRSFLATRLPAANGKLRSAMTCRYTNTVDQHFVIDRNDPDIVVISACSGHGFKFAPVIGEIVAAIATGVPLSYEIGLFAPSTARSAAMGVPVHLLN